MLANRGSAEDENWGMWSFQTILFHAFGPIPIVRDFALDAVKKATDQKNFGYRFTPATSGVETAGRIASDIGNVIEGEETKNAT